MTGNFRHWVVRPVGWQAVPIVGGLYKDRLREQTDSGRLTSITMMSATASVVSTPLAPSIVRGSPKLSLSGYRGAKCWDCIVRDLQHDCTVVVLGLITCPPTD